MNKPYFHYVFQINKMVVFNVNYYLLGSNRTPHFATSAVLFIRSKRGFAEGGQCQESVLPKDSLAYQFYTKWDICHLQDLTDEQYNDLCADIELLKEQYNYVYSAYDNINFEREVELSKMPLKKTKV